MEQQMEQQIEQIEQQLEQQMEQMEQQMEQPLQQQVENEKVAIVQQRKTKQLSRSSNKGNPLDSPCDPV